MRVDIRLHLGRPVREAADIIAKRSVAGVSGDGIRGHRYSGRDVLVTRTLPAARKSRPERIRLIQRAVPAPGRY